MSCTRFACLTPASAPAPPRTITKEWEEASNERALEQKTNPIHGTYRNCPWPSVWTATDVPLRPRLCSSSCAAASTFVQVSARRATLAPATLRTSRCTCGVGPGSCSRGNMHRRRQLAQDGQERTVRPAPSAPAEMDARSYNPSNLLLYSCYHNQLELQTQVLCVYASTEAAVWASVPRQRTPISPQKQRVCGPGEAKAHQRRME